MGRITRNGVGGVGVEVGVSMANGYTLRSGSIEVGVRRANGHTLSSGSRG